MFRHSSRKAKGYATWNYPDQKPIEKDTMQCVHCGAHWYIDPGSGIQRGWCMNCNGPTCGKKECCECIPFMKKIETAEKRARLFEAMGLGD